MDREAMSLEPTDENLMRTLNDVASGFVLLELLVLSLTPPDKRCSVLTSLP